MEARTCKTETEQKKTNPWVLFCSVSLLRSLYVASVKQAFNLVEASNVINVLKRNKGPKCNKNLVLNVIKVLNVINRWS